NGSSSSKPIFQALKSCNAMLHKLLAPEPQRTQPSIDLTKSILLPLFGSAIAQNRRALHKTPDTVWPESVHAIELLRDVAIAEFSACMPKQRAARFRQCFDPAAIIAHAVVNIVSVFLFETIAQSVTFHGEQGGY